MIKLQQILQELSKTGAMTGTQEKEFNIGLRKIHGKFADMERDNITPQTPHSEINYGGCGVFAKLLYYNMRKYLGITPEITFFDRWPNKQLPKGKINQYSSLREAYRDDHMCIHITLKVGNHYIDSSGVHSRKWWDKVYPSIKLVEQEGLTIQTLTKWVATSNNWNSTFNRYSIGDINKDMVEVLKAVKNAVIAKKQ